MTNLKDEYLPVEQLSYEQAMKELEEIIATLESGQTSLEQSIDLFERGQVLAKHCSTLLNQAELKVQQLPTDTGLSEDHPIPF